MSSRNQTRHQESQIMASPSVPLGYKCEFAPEDHELITYLFCKANGWPLPSEGAIKEVKLFQMDPKSLFPSESQENIVYIFTKVKKVHDLENGNSTVDRKVGENLLWKEIDEGQPIYDGRKLIGQKQKFGFVNNVNMNLGYNMTEFVLDNERPSSVKFKYYVLCRIEREVKEIMSTRNQTPHQESNKEAEIMVNSSLPFGCKLKFEPEDHELITFLSRKANGQPLPSEGKIKEVKLYQMYPKDLFPSESREKIVYIFTELWKLFGEVNRQPDSNRLWKEVDEGQPIYDNGGLLIGHKQKFGFVNNRNENVGYKMTEFILDKQSLDSENFKDYVLCRIKRKLKKVKSNQKNDAMEEGDNDAVKEEVGSSSRGDTVSRARN